MCNRKLFWFALYCKPKWETIVANQLDQSEIEFYLPLKRIYNYKPEGKVLMIKPLFPSVLFVNIEEDKKDQLKKINGVINFIHWLDKPATISDIEITSIKNYLDDYYNVILEKVVFEETLPGQMESGEKPFNKGAVNFGGIDKVFLPSLGYLLNGRRDKTKIEQLLQDSERNEFGKKEKMRKEEQVCPAALNGLDTTIYRNEQKSTTPERTLENQLMNVSKI